MARIGLLATCFLSLFGLGCFQGHDHGHPIHSSGLHANDLGRHVVFLDQPGSHDGHGTHSDHGAGDTHVDRPGEHGNHSPFPVVHRPHVAGDHGSHGTSGSQGDIHVDLPGQHGNDSPFPGVHRVVGEPHDGHAAHEQHVAGDTHIDRPGQHGNDSPFSVVHRTGSGDQGHGHSPHGGETHIDRPGEHGNTSPVAVVHRTTGNGQGGHSSHVGDLHTEGRGHSGHDPQFMDPHGPGISERGIHVQPGLSRAVLGLRPRADMELGRFTRPRFLPPGDPNFPYRAAPFPPFGPRFLPPPGVGRPPPLGPMFPPFRRYPPMFMMGPGRPRLVRIPARRRLRRLRRLLRARDSAGERQGSPGLLTSILNLFGL